jgi:hypothetical protein
MGSVAGDSSMRVVEPASAPFHWHVKRCVGGSTAWFVFFLGQPGRGGERKAFLAWFRRVGRALKDFLSACRSATAPFDVG